MKTILFTAFGDFPHGQYRCNTTELLAEELGGTILAGHRIVTKVFPCRLCHPDENRGEALLALARDIGARGIISTGMSSAAEGIRIETIARNQLRNQKYCSPSQLTERIIDACSTDWKFDMPLTVWRLRHFREACKQEDIQVSFSYDAGGFCCEELMTQMCWGQYLRSLVPFIFLHVSCSPEAVQSFREHRAAGKTTMPLWQMFRAITLLLERAELT